MEKFSSTIEKIMKAIAHKIIISLCMLCLALPAFSQRAKWTWPAGVEGARVRSFMDKTGQMAMFYAARSFKPQPLIVVIHGWNQIYRSMPNELIDEIVARDYNCIIPNLRGASNTPLACGSEYVVADLEDAIGYAIENAKVDVGEIHIVSVLDGGHNALVAYMKATNYPIKSVTSWCGISDLEGLVDHIKGKNLFRYINFVNDIMAVTESNDEHFNREEAARRSPIKMKVPKARKKTKLYLYAGINDGVRSRGPVPYMQSVDMYNLVTETFIHKEQPVTQDEIIKARSKLDPESCEKIGTRNIVFKKSNKYVDLIIFDGAHEMFYEQAMNLVPIGK